MRIVAGLLTGNERSDVRWVGAIAGDGCWRRSTLFTTHVRLQRLLDIRRLTDGQTD